MVWLIAALALAPMVMLVSFDTDDSDEDVSAADGEETPQDAAEDQVVPLGEVLGASESAEDPGADTRPPTPPTPEEEPPVTTTIEDPPALDALRFEGEETDDTVQGSNANDTLMGGDGDDLLQGAGGYDLIDGGDGDDRLIGGRLNLDDGQSDTLDGGDGDDIIVMGTTDSATGGDGDDTFVAAGISTVVDFNPGEDVLVITHDGGDVPSIESQSVTEGGVTLTLSHGVTVMLEGLDQEISEDLVSFLDASSEDPLAV
jgi:hypothetical protein